MTTHYLDSIEQLFGDCLVFPARQAKQVIPNTIEARYFDNGANRDPQFKHRYNGDFQFPGMRKPVWFGIDDPMSIGNDFIFMFNNLTNYPKSYVKLILQPKLNIVALETQFDPTLPIYYGTLHITPRSQTAMGRCSLVAKGKLTELT